jgi:hypothetical protein
VHDALIEAMQSSDELLVAAATRTMKIIVQNSLPLPVSHDTTIIITMSTDSYCCLLLLYLFILLVLSVRERPRCPQISAQAVIFSPHCCQLVIKLPSMLPKLVLFHIMYSSIFQQHPFIIHIVASYYILVKSTFSSPIPDI